MAHEAVLCGPQGLFARLISSWKGLLRIFWQTKRSKPKPSSVWFSRNQFGFAAKTFFFLVITSFLGQIPVILIEISTDLQRRPFFFGLYLVSKYQQIPEILAKVSTNIVQQTWNYLEFNLGKNACGPQ